MASPNGLQIPLGDLVEIKYEQGPQAIKSEDGFLVGYVLFDKEAGFAEVEVVTIHCNSHCTGLNFSNSLFPIQFRYYFPDGIFRCVCSILRGLYNDMVIWSALVYGF